MKKAGKKSMAWLRIWIYIIIAGLLVLLGVHSHDSLSTAVHLMRQASPGWLAVAIGSMALSLPATALVYGALSPQPLPFWRTVWVQTAGFCVNKLLPSGTGAAGVSFLYLRANKLNNVVSGALVLINNLLGFAGHFVLFWLLVALQPEVLDKLHIGNRQAASGLWWALGIVLALIAIAFVFARARTLALGMRLMKQLRPLMVSRPKFGRALLYSMVITLSYTLTLWASAHAVGGPISLSAAIIALSTSVLASSAIPSPGGIGVAELGAYGGLVAVGLPHDTALAAALLYRVCSFWLPLAAGSFALIGVTQRGYLAKPR
jgi:uncharacterized membrane protein YbhN (UPF0104 family)